MGIITLRCFRSSGALQNMCNIFLRKLIRKRVVIFILIILLGGYSFWMLDDAKRENFKSKLSMMKLRYVMDQSQQTFYIRPNISVPGMADDIMALEPPIYLPDYKNPCWYEKSDGKSPQRRCLPYFYLIGVDKCGTTDLFIRMLQHPQILRTNAINSKETHWWSWRRFGYDTFINNAKILHFEDYLQVYDPTSARLNKTQIFGDGSPTYFWDFTGWPLIPNNKGKRNPEILTPHCIHHLTPNAKFILILRNPIDRLYSDYLFLFQKNISPQTFHTGVLSAITEFEECEMRHSTRLCLFNKTLHMNTHVRLLIGMYGNYLLEWLNVFPAKQFLILKTEEYKVDMKGHLRKIFEFLGLDPLSESHLKVISAGRHVFERSDKLKKLGPMSPTTRMLLEHFYSKNKFKVNHILNDKRFIWR